MKTSKLNVVELYCGKATISKEFESRGHNTFKIDIRKRKGICEPDLRIDIMCLELSQIPFDKIDIVWCSFPCTVWSYAAGSFHFKEGEPQTELAKQHVKLLKRTLELISKMCPSLYFIENPRGRLRYNKMMVDWLTKNDGMTKILTYASYNAPITKPTNLFTNAYGFKCRELFGFGRGHKSPTDSFDKMTTDQRQQIPKELAIDLVNYCEKINPDLSFKTSQVFAEN